MKVIVYTGRIQDGWTDLIDTTFKFAEREPQVIGAILAPPKYLVFGHKAWRGDKRFSNWQSISTEEYQQQYRAILLPSDIAQAVLCPSRAISEAAGRR
jgi:hypothetical protein